MPDRLAWISNHIRKQVSQRGDPTRDEVASKRRYRSVSKEYVVVEVTEMVRLTEKKYALVDSTTYSHWEIDMIWKWGPFTDTIRVTTHLHYVGPGGGTKLEETKTVVLERAGKQVRPLYLVPSGPNAF